MRGGGSSLAHLIAFALDHFRTLPLRPDVIGHSLASRALIRAGGRASGSVCHREPRCARLRPPRGAAATLWLNPLWNCAPTAAARQTETPDQIAGRASSFLSLSWMMTRCVDPSSSGPAGVSGRHASGRGGAASRRPAPAATACRVQERGRHTERSSRCAPTRE
jgi:hypothetical protein